MKLRILVTLFVLQQITYQQNINDLIAQYQNGGGNMSAAFDPKSIKLPSINQSSIEQLRGYAEKRAAEQYDFNTILQKQLQSGNQELQNELQNSPFFQNQVSNLNLSNVNQQNQQQLQNLILSNSSQINAQFQQQYQQNQLNSLQNQQNQLNSLQNQQPQNTQNLINQSQLTQQQKNQLLSNPQLLGQLQQMLQQQQQQPNQNQQLDVQQPQQQNQNQRQQVNNLFDNSSRNQIRQDVIKLGDNNQLREVSRSIKGDPSLAPYLDLLSSFEKGRFITESGTTVDNCEILERISPINQPKEQLKQCKPIHFHGIGDDEICFIYACMTFNKDVMFYRLCLNAIPLEQDMLNLNNVGLDTRKFDKDYNPNRFQRDSDFSLDDPIDCKNGKKIIRDPSLIDIK